jgi:hypothetical protein
MLILCIDENFADCRIKYSNLKLFVVPKKCACTIRTMQQPKLANQWMIISSCSCFAETRMKDYSASVNMNPAR